MQRRDVLKKITLAAGSMVVGAGVKGAVLADKDNDVLRIAHITDVHIRDGDNAPERFKKCLAAVKESGVDFIVNTGDSIHDASYKNVTRENVIEQWAIWDDCMKSLTGYEVHSCLGNHDMWWEAPSKEDDMYGKPYAVSRLKMPHRYYSFCKKNWHFIVLDGNNEGISLDEEQFNWLANTLSKVPVHHYVLLMSHYPILGTTPLLVGGGHSDFKKLKNLFYQHKDKVRVCLSGHNHLFDKTFYNGVGYFCNGAMSGYWWGKGDKESAGEGYYLETAPGYALLTLHKDGSASNEYVPHGL